MNTATNHLVSVDTRIDLPGNYTPLPENLRPAAERKLAGRSEATVARHSGGKLSRWAAAQRKARCQMAATSRKRNRS